MAKLTLSYGGGLNRLQPILDGRVEVQGIELMPTLSMASETFWRQLNFSHFQFSEMSISSFLIAKDQGADLVGIPAFPVRRFTHTENWYHVDSGIEKPSDLAGKRVGVHEYQQTSSLWMRGVIEHDFGVSQYDIEWYMERTEEMSHGRATEFVPPDGIKFHHVPPGKLTRQMLLDHELDSAQWGPRSEGRERDPYAIGPNAWNFVDRETIGRPLTGDRSKVRPLFPDPLAEYRRFVDAHGFIPATHMFAVRGDIDEEYPWVAFNLLRALIDAKTILYRDLPAYAPPVVFGIPSPLVFGPGLLPDTRSLVENDPFPYGVEANRDMLEFMIQMSHEQGLIKSRLDLSDVFKPEFAHI